MTMVVSQIFIDCRQNERQAHTFYKNKSFYFEIFTISTVVRKHTLKQLSEICTPVKAIKQNVV